MKAAATVRFESRVQWAGRMAAMALVGLSATAARAAENIAVINIADVFDGYQMTTDLERLFQLSEQKIKEQSQTRLTELDTRRKELEAFAPGTPDFKERDRTLVRLEMEYQVWLGFEQRMLRDEHMRRLMQIYEDTQSAVRGVAESRGIDLVLTYDRLSADAPDSVSMRQQILLQKVIYANDKIDLTQPVLEQLNRAYQERGGIDSLKFGAADAQRQNAITEADDAIKVATGPDDDHETS